jgi:hypothetical protein
VLLSLSAALLSNSHLGALRSFFHQLSRHQFDRARLAIAHVKKAFALCGGEQTKQQEKGSCRDAPRDMPPIGKERRDCARKEAEKKLEHRDKGKGVNKWGERALERRLHSP